MIAGHVDSTTGPGVFVDLRRLGPGDRVEVVGAAGRARAFTVRAVDRTDKDVFPTGTVYGPNPVSELRIVTCGGDFSSRSRSHRDNIIVSAASE